MERTNLKAIINKGGQHEKRKRKRNKVPAGASESGCGLFSQGTVSRAEGSVQQPAGKEADPSETGEQKLTVSNRKLPAEGRERGSGIPIERLVMSIK